MERRGGQPRPELSSKEPSQRVIRGAELERLKASRPQMRESRFALEWTDEQGRYHLQYNHRLTTVDPDGKSHVLSRYDEPPTFETRYQDWHQCTTGGLGRNGVRRPGEIYTLYLDPGSREHRSSLKRFLRAADEAGYSVTGWFSTPRSGMTTQEDDEVTSLTFLLHNGSTEEQISDEA